MVGGFGSRSLHQSRPGDVESLVPQRRGRPLLGGTGTAARIGRLSVDDAIEPVWDRRPEYAERSNLAGVREQRTSTASRTVRSGSLPTASATADQLNSSRTSKHSMRAAQSSSRRSSGPPENERLSVADSPGQ